MTDNTWTQRAGMTSDTDTDNLETYAEQAEASKVAAAASETAAAGSASSASTSAATATTKAAESASSATQSASSATASAASATQSASSATASANSATTAGAAQTAAETAKTGAETAQTAAETAQTAAETAETNAATSEAAALASKNAAATSATNSSTSATNSANSATASETSRVASVAAQAAAETAETNAETAETNAAASASAASTSASNASTSETNAATSASTATTQAGIATAKAGEAATSATASANSATASEAAKDAALAALDSFDDRYLGAKASDPTLDNDGNALVSGALYFNTTDDVMKVYEGSQWVAAYASLSGALLVNNNLSDVADAAGSRANLGLGTAATTASTDYATAAQGALAASATQPGDLATVATSGAYSDLSGTPTLGTAAAAAATDFVAVTGDTMTGDLTVPNVVVSGNVDGRDVSADGTKLDGIEAGADVTDTANVTAAGAAMETGASFTGDVTFGDNDKAIFGAGSDLQIYYDGSKSIIADAGSGNLQLRANDFQLMDAAATKNIIRGYDATGAVGLHYGGSEKLATTSTGIDVTGTVTADGLTVDGAAAIGANATKVNFYSDSTYSGIYNGSSLASDEAIYMGGDAMFFYAAGKQRLNINAGGDISFYEDTGTTPKFFWDASAESLGIGTSSPSYSIHTKSSSGGVGLIESTSSNSDLYFKDSGTTYNYSNGIGSVGNALRFRSGDGSERMRIDSSGNVGIGTSSPSGSGLHIKKDTASTTNELLRLSNSAGSTTDGVKLVMEVANTSGNGGEIGTVRDGGSFNPYMYFSTSAGVGSSPSERMRLDSSGNLLVGTTSSAISNSHQITSTSDATINSSAVANQTAALSLSANIGSQSNTAEASNVLVLRGNSGLSATPGDLIKGYGGNGASTLNFKVEHNGNIYSAGDVSATNFNTTSDATLKTNVETLSGSLDAVKSLRGVSFDWLENGGSEIGVIAQEVEAVLPDVVSTNDEGIKSVKYGNMVAVLIEAIKEQQLRIEALEAKLGE